MSPDDLSRALDPQSFRPFVINMSNGEHYLVSHPEQVMVDRRVAVIGTRRMDGARRFENVAICALVHIVSLIPAEETEVR
jgi:hypothetical protein